MPINLTLNDFRNVLGQVNDGDVVLRQDKTGIEKANYGNAFLNLFRNVRTATPSAEENIQVRMMLMNAIQASSEGKVLTDKAMLDIHAALGMPDGVDANAMAKPLTRRELKAVIDIIDSATRNDALIEKDIAALEKGDMMYQHVAKGVKTAMRDASCFKEAGTEKEQIAQFKERFGEDFRGLKPEEVRKFVRANMPVIREQVFDRLYWEHGLTTESMAEPGLDSSFNASDTEDVAIAPEVADKVFNEVVGSLMEKMGKGEIILTRAETLAALRGTSEIGDASAAKIYATVIKGDTLEAIVDDVLTQGGSGQGAFADVQLGRASTALKSFMRETFSRLYVENKYNTQDAEKDFAGKLGPLLTTLREVAADLKGLDDETLGAVRSRIADKFGEMVFTEGIATKTSGEVDALVKAMSDAVKTFSSRQVVQQFVDSRFAYLDDKGAVVEFFMDKISAAGTKDGITTEQRGALSTYQGVIASGGAANQAKVALDVALLNPLAQAYSDKVAGEDPAAVARLRSERNERTFTAICRSADPGFDALPADKKAKAILEAKIKTVIGEIDYEGLFGLGVTQSPHSSGIKTITHEEVNPETGKKRFVSEPDPEALKALDDHLLAMDDKDLAFFASYSANGMSDADNLFTASAEQSGIGCGPVFKNALRDGTVSMSDIPREAVTMLETCIKSQMFALQEGTTHLSMDVPVRGLMKSDQYNGPVGLGLFERLQSGFKASGISPVPDVFVTTGKESASQISQRLGNPRNNGFTRMWGFGTMDLMRVLKLFDEMGVSLAPLGGDDVKAKIDVYEKVICLSMIAAMDGFKLDDLPEFTQRIMGKSFDKVTYADVMSAMSKLGIVSDGFMADNLLVTDPLSGLKGGAKTVKQLFAGELALSGASLSAGEVTELLSNMRSLGAIPMGKQKSVSMNIQGTAVQFTRLAGGGLSVSIGGMPFRSAFDTNGVVRMLENEITSKPGSFGPDVVKGALPPPADVKSGKIPLVRARELYAKTAAAKTGTLPVMFSAYSTDELYDVAMKAVDGKFSEKDLPTNPPGTYNSGAMIEMHEALSLTSSAEIDAKVQLATKAGRSIVERRTVPPDAQTVRNVIADLFLNKDTWEFDAGASGKAQPGERVRKLLVEHAPELGFILKQDGLDLLSGLPQAVRDGIQDVLGDIRGIDIGKLADVKSMPDGMRAQLAAIEAKIDKVATTLVDSLQDKVATLFGTQSGGGVAKETWQKTFAELTGKEGIDDSTKQGEFTMKVLKNYFKNSAPVDKRAMLSAFIRNTTSDSSDAKQVAELLKGAGPLLQKMLQGLPLSSFNAETQLALKDMKSRLLPIPDEAVKAQMLELVRSSNGEIFSIEVKKSLGAASVGQAFLCTIKTKDHPYQGVECVVKLLRPNVDTAIQREKALIDKLVADDPAMKATFDGQYKKILEEFDLTLESTNVGIGTKVYDRPGGVGNIHTMELLEGTQSTMTSMIVKKAEGTTFDSRISQLRGEAEAVLAPLKQTSVVDGKTKTVYKASSANECAIARRKLVAKVAQLNDRRNQILDVTRAWSDNALFGNGFFHGDLHGGNLMTSPAGTTFIDFGNCSRLSEKEQNAIKLMFATTMTSDTEKVIGEFKGLLSPEGLKAFEDKFKKGSPGMKQLDEILHRGNGYDLMPRLQAFLATVQGEDVPIPPAMQNFVQSYMRLSDIVTEIDNTVADIMTASASIYYDTDVVNPVPGESKVFAGIRDVMRAFVGSSDSPCSIAVIDDAAEAADAYLETQEGKDELKTLTHDIDKIRNVLKPFIDQMATVECVTRSELNPVSVHAGAPAIVSSVRAEVERLLTLEAEGKLETKEGQETMDRLEEELGLCARRSAEDLIRHMSTEHRGGGESTFLGVAKRVDMSMTDVCTGVIYDHASEIQPLVTDKFGRFGVLGFALQLKTAVDTADADVARRKKIEPRLAAENRKVDPGERLSGQELATISRAATPFLIQSPRPDETSGWCSSKDKRGAFLTAVEYNLSRVSTALGIAPGQHLSATAVRHAALSFGLYDSKVIGSVASLSDGDYNQLLAEASQMDAVIGGSELATALAALRTAKPILDEIAK